MWKMSWLDSRLACIYICTVNDQVESVWPSSANASHLSLTIVSPQYCGICGNGGIVLALTHKLIHPSMRANIVKMDQVQCGVHRPQREIGRKSGNVTRRQTIWPTLTASVHACLHTYIHATQVDVVLIYVLLCTTHVREPGLQGAHGSARIYWGSRSSSFSVQRLELNRILLVLGVKK